MAQPTNPNLNGMLSADEMKQLTELLGNNSVLLDKGNGKKKGKMTPQAKNQILNKLSSQQKSQETQKPLKEMTEQEKKQYREELKKRLHNKQDMFKQMRSNQNLLQKSLDTKIKKSTETMKKEEVQNALQTAQPLPNNNIDNININNNIDNKEEELEDFINTN